MQVKDLAAPRTEMDPWIPALTRTDAAQARRRAKAMRPAIPARSAAANTCLAYGCVRPMLHKRHYVSPIKPNHLARLRFPEIVI